MLVNNDNSKVQIGYFATLFISQHADLVTGEMPLTGFTAGNTREIEIIKDSLQISQAVAESYIESSNLVDTDTFADKISNVNVPEGTFSFSTYFTSSPSGPMVPKLWNSLLNRERTYYSDRTEISLFRNSMDVPEFGLIVVAKGITYLLDHCRIQALDINADPSQITTLTWSGNFTTIRVLGQTVLSEEEETERYTMSGALTGFAQDDKISNYTITASRFTKVGIASTGQSESFAKYVAFSNFNISITNTLMFLENKGVDRTNLKQIFAGTKKFDITGNATMYTRSDGPAYELLQELLAARNPDPDKTDIEYRNLYVLYIDILNQSGETAAKLVIDGLSLTISTNTGQVYSNDLRFKLSETENSKISAIKFYN